MFSLPGSTIISPAPLGLPCNFQPESIDFFNKTVNGLLTDTEMIALDYLISSYKAYGLWDKLKDGWPLLGGDGTTGSRANFCLSLKGNFDLTYGSLVFDYNCNRTGYRHSGSVNNGAQAFWNTRINDLTMLDPNNKGLSCYINKTSQKNNIYDMGVLEGSYASLFALTVLGQISPNPQVTQGFGNFNATTNSSIAGFLDSAPANGFYSTNRIGAQVDLYKNGINRASCIMREQRVGANANIYLNCVRYTLGTTAEVSNRGYGSWYVHKAYTPQEELYRVRIEQNFQTMLGRSVPLN